MIIWRPFRPVVFAHLANDLREWSVRYNNLCSNFRSHRSLAALAAGQSLANDIHDAKPCTGLLSISL